MTHPKRTRDPDQSRPGRSWTFRPDGDQVPSAQLELRRNSPITAPSVPRVKPLDLGPGAAGGCVFSRAARRRSATNLVARPLRRESDAGVLQPGFEKTRGYPERARSTRGTSQPVFVLFRQIQQAPFRELIGVFSKVAAPIGLLF